MIRLVPLVLLLLLGFSVQESFGQGSGPAVHAPDSIAVDLSSNAQAHEKYGLIVGISDYPGSSFDLPLVTVDVRAATNMFINVMGIREENIVILENEQATRENILNGITQFLGNAGKDGTAVFYYSGHGTRTEENVAIVAPLDNESDGRDEAIVAWDALLVDDEIAYALNSINADKVLVLFDSCHSGDAIRGDNDGGMFKMADYIHVSKYISLPAEFRVAGSGDTAFSASAGSGIDTSREGRLFIAASGENELSWVAPKLGMSTFTYFLTEKIAQSSEMSFAEFVNELHPLVTQYAEEHFRVPQSTHLESSPASAQMSIGAFFK